MRKSLIAAFALVSVLAGCMEDDGSRAAVGAGAGYIGATIFGGSQLMGVAAGAAVGALCDDVRLCQ